MPPRKKAKKSTAWQEIAQEAQSIRERSLVEVDDGMDLPKSRANNVLNAPNDVLTERELSITSTTPQDLVSFTKSGGISAHEITRAFLRRVVVAQKTVFVIFSSNSCPPLTLLDKLHLGAAPKTSLDPGCPSRPVEGPRALTRSSYKHQIAYRAQRPPQFGGLHLPLAQYSRV